jgi:hypothetical protein
MKAKLSGLTVRTKDGPKRVPVWYSMPSREREKSYPFITIDLVDIVFAEDRAHSAQIMPIDYWPSEYPSFAAYAASLSIPYDEDTMTAEAVWWHPYDLHYQVATHCRNAQHDRELTAKLIHTKYLPDRWGYLDVPADGSSRWLDRIGYGAADYYEQAGEDKHVFRKIYNISVSAHVAPEDPFIYHQVLRAAMTLTTGDSGTTTTWTEEFTP